MQHTPKQRIAAITAALMATGWHVAAAGQELARAVTSLQQLQARVTKAGMEKQTACTAAQVDQTRLFAVTAADEKQLKASVASAYKSHQLCERAKRDEDDAKLQVEANWELLNKLAPATASAAETPARPALAPAHPAADAPGTQTASATPATQAPVLPAPMLVAKGTKDLIEDAGKAQAKVAKARADYADPFGDTDSATARLLADAAISKKDREDLIVEVRAARESALSVRKSMRAAQVAANQLTDSALTLKDCHPTCANAGPQQVAHSNADRAQIEMTVALQAAKDAFEKGKQAALAVKLGADYPKDSNKRKDARAFAELMDKFPDASSLIGEASAFKVSATGNASTATIKLGNARDLPRGWRQTSFTLSVPVNAATNPQLLSREEGINDAAKLGFSTYWLNAGSKDVLLSSDSHLSAIGIKANLGMANKASYLGADLKTKESTERAFREGSAGGYLALFQRPREDSKTHSVHVLSLDFERKLNRGKQEVRCPAQPATGATSLTCVTDYFTAPKFNYARKLGYEFRFQGANWALAPKVEYEDVEHTTTARLPLYWILSEDTKGGSSYSAGVDVQWQRARRASDGKTKTESSVGVFVSMPFSLYAVDR